MRVLTQVHRKDRIYVGRNAGGRGRALLRGLHSALLTLLLIGILFATSSCERRELYVSGEGFFSLLLNVDWSDYDEESEPDGMTVWFYPLDASNPTDDAEKMTNNDHDPFKTITANVRKETIYVPNGRYQAVVINYSPDEYSEQEFFDMNSIHDARVVSRADVTQPMDIAMPGALISDSSQTAARNALYGDAAWGKAIHQRSKMVEGGYYQLASKPESMASDTLHNRLINSGTDYGDYIPYLERDTYQKKITVNELNSKPHSLIWYVTLRVYIKSGIDNLWQTRASLSGLADGHYLARHVNTDTPTLIAIDDWKKEANVAGDGYIYASFACFGLCPSTISSEAEYHPSEEKGKSRYDGRHCDIGAHFSKVCKPETVQLNLLFILRDQKTIVYHDFDVSSTINNYGEQLVIDVDLDEEFFKGGGGGGGIDFPEVVPYKGNTTGFDADVTPWEDGGTADTNM